MFIWNIFCDHWIINNVILRLIDAPFFTKQQWPPVVTCGHYTHVNSPLTSNMKRAEEQICNLANWNVYVND